MLLNDAAPTETSLLSLHDALPISDAAQDADHPAEDGRVVAGDRLVRRVVRQQPDVAVATLVGLDGRLPVDHGGDEDRKSTRLNSSHLVISYAVFCLKKKTRAK